MGACKPRPPDFSRQWPSAALHPPSPATAETDAAPIDCAGSRSMTYSTQASSSSWSAPAAHASRIPSRTAAMGSQLLEGTAGPGRVDVHRERGVDRGGGADNAGGPPDPSCCSDGEISDLLLAGGKPQSGSLSPSGSRVGRDSEQASTSPSCSRDRARRSAEESPVQGPSWGVMAMRPMSSVRRRVHCCTSVSSERSREGRSMTGMSSKRGRRG